MPYHPGGASKLMLAAGKDGTDLFNKFHAWVNIDSILGKCVVGVAMTDIEEQGYAEWEAEQAIAEQQQQQQPQDGVNGESAEGHSQKAQVTHRNSFSEDSAHAQLAPITPLPAVFDLPSLSDTLAASHIVPRSPTTPTTPTIRLTKELESDSSAAAQSLLVIRRNSLKTAEAAAAGAGGLTSARSISSLTAVLDPNTILYSGELSKQGHLIRNWKTRHFELRPYEIRYYDSSKVLKGNFLISGASITTDSPSSLEFSLRSPSNKVLTMRAANGQVKLDWMQHINAQLNALLAHTHTQEDWNESDEDEENEGSAISSAPSNVTSATGTNMIPYPPPTDAQLELAVTALNEERVIACGTMSKRGQVNTSWKSRYFELLPQDVKYYEKADSGTKVLKGAFHLVNANIFTDPNSLEFMLSHTSTRTGQTQTLALRAENTNSKNNWLKAISIQVAFLSRR
jgi:hypothetical protein